MEIYTIGFTKRDARDFFETLRRAGIGLVLDVRLRPSSQLSGFTKARDMPYFAQMLLSAEYAPEPLLAPTSTILDAYRAKRMSWSEYEEEYLTLLETRQVQDKVVLGDQDRPLALLCSEFDSTKCHRRLAAEYLARSRSDLTIRHL